MQLHLKDEGGRADLAALLPRYAPGWQLYTCGSPRYMDAVFTAAAALRAGPRRRCTASTSNCPRRPSAINHPFQLKLARSGRVLQVPADASATEVLAQAGVAVPTKCSDGLCGVCAVAYDAAASSPVEHRDVVLGAAERQRRIILCCSRAARRGGLLVLDL